MALQARLQSVVSIIGERVQAAKEWFDALPLSERDRRAVLWGALGVLVLVVLIFFHTMSTVNKRLEMQEKALREQLEEIKSLEKEYYASKKMASEIAEGMSSPNQSLLSVIERILVSENIERASFTISSRSPTSWELYEEISVDVKIQKIALDKVIDVLYEIENSPTFLKISKFKMSARFDNPNLLDVSFRISNYKFQQVI
ncbi:MAG: hypothetical protein QXX77_06120 [Candidatus Methanosuratincola sp.]|jgi:general secretion pathway protein M